METRKRGSKSVFFRRKMSCLGRVTILPQLCHDLASVVSRSCLSCVTILPQLCHNPASVVSQSCLSCVTILPRTCHANMMLECLSTPKPGKPPKPFFIRHLGGY